MAAQTVPALTEPMIGSVEDARAHVASGALRASSLGRVGLELEFHLVDRGRPQRRVDWARLRELQSGLPAMPAGSRVSVEPGGQVELSTAVAPDVGSAVSALRRDKAALAAALKGAGVGLAPIGADPARPVQRVNPAGRYVAMERHFDAMGCGGAGRAMMSATAALQVNVEAGPRQGWPARISRMHTLGPVLVALSGCSPLLAGRASGWHSMRQQVWGLVDPARCAPPRFGMDPGLDWASYALTAPVMLVRDPATAAAAALTRRIAFADWIAGEPSIGRRPTLADLDYHLSTLFPPVRLRGFLEVRCLDAVPDRWWPALAALTVTLLDDEVAADLAAEACEQVSSALGAGAWAAAAREGLGDRSLSRATSRCATIAAAHCAAELRPEVEAYADLLSRGRTPGHDLSERAALRGPLTVLEEEADA